MVASVFAPDDDYRIAFWPRLRLIVFFLLFHLITAVGADLAARQIGHRKRPSRLQRHQYLQIRAESWISPLLARLFISSAFGYLSFPHVIEKFIFHCVYRFRAIAYYALYARRAAIHGSSRHISRAARQISLSCLHRHSIFDALLAAFLRATSSART